MFFFTIVNDHSITLFHFIFHFKFQHLTKWLQCNKIRNRFAGNDFISNFSVFLFFFIIVNYLAHFLNYYDHVWTIVFHPSHSFDTDNSLLLHSHTCWQKLKNLPCNGDTTRMNWAKTKCENEHANLENC